jgi:type VI protein secretion system component VasK
VSTNECVAVAVLYPWRWISIAIWVAVLIVSLLNLWRYTRACRDTALTFEQMAQVCDRAGLDDQAAEVRRLARQMRRCAWPRRVRLPAPPPEPGPVLAKPGEPR